ncbi:ABC-type Fe3+/spermidine/putrescine transport system ATPase subunit [Raoultella sp. BIGb0132]|nr:ABC-type Fe3+/spermidine/putrescine transport system ATPase subunit [Raoultella sp. BIGb0132]MCS4287004.1 ABC-type Fe3+/spermidine/putrescine transport system ATPase subunit [Raoultella terrigena]
MLDNLNLTVAPGSRTAIVGPSGSGKTTMLRILAGFETPDTGRIVMQGKTLYGDGIFIPAHQRGIGFVPQEGRFSLILAWRTIMPGGWTIPVRRSGVRWRRFTQVGSPFTVYSQPVDEATALFLGDALVLPARLSAGRAECIIGEVLTDGDHATGSGRIMLRPEVTLCQEDESAMAIVDVDFYGHLSTLSLAAPGMSEPLILKTVSQAGWTTGARVRLAVAGKARVFMR